MPAQTKCAQCERVGFVRWEKVVTGQQAVIEYYCGYCEHTWTTTEGGKPHPARRTGPSSADRPDRSRQ